MYQSELKEILTKNDKSIPRRFRREYFVSLDKKHISDWIDSIYEESKFDFGDACKAVLNGVLAPHSCSTCGKTVISWAKKNNCWRRFCSDSCRNSDPNISEMKKSIWTPENKKSGALAREAYYLDNYGVTHNMQVRVIAEKSGAAIKKSRECRTQTEKALREKSYRQSRMPNTHHLVDDKDWLFEQYVTQEKSVISISRAFGISGEAVKNAILRHGIPYTPERENAQFISHQENDLYNFIKTLRPDAVQSFRNGYELDVYIPELKLGFEYNGCYYHSEAYKDREYHSNKVNHFYKLGIRVVQIWSDSWLQNNARTKNFIKNILLREKSLGARKCELRQISNSEFKNFLEETHMQGSTGASVRYGLFNSGTLLCVMGFKKVANNDSKGGYELCRFANKNVVGGFSKLLAEFKKNFGGVHIYSFSDLETVDPLNNVYTKNGFIEVGRIVPDYKYFNPRSKVREHKFGWRKSTFEKLGYSVYGKTEAQLAKEAGLLKCWDSGKIIYKCCL